MLTRLQDAPNFQLAENEPDVRGWEVFDASCTPLGKVDSLIVDTDAEQIRYLTVNTRHGAEMIAIDDLDFDERDHQILLHGTVEAPMASPMPDTTASREDMLAPETQAPPTAPHQTSTGMAPGALPFSSTASNTMGRTGMALPPAMPHRLRLNRIPEPPSQPATPPSTGEQIELRREHVSVDRRRVDKPLSETEYANHQGKAIETEDEIRTPVIVERMEVRKVPYVVEEIVMRKQSDTVQQRVRTEEFMASEPEPDQHPSLGETLKRKLGGR